MQRWEKRPTLEDFTRTYFDSIAESCDSIFDGPEDLYEAIADVSWAQYRKEVIELNPEFEETRVRRHLKGVQDLLGMELEGEIILFSTFAGMDGYARFDRGTHRVFLGVDENHGVGQYLDILEPHELTHVARESQPSVWEGFGLNPKMSHHEFTENQPVIEHLFGEGFSCAVSEILTPTDAIWHYAYQERESLAQVMEHAPRVDHTIHHEIQLGDQGDYGRLYNPSRYGARLPSFTHYVWAWQWAKKVIQDFGGGDPRKVLSVCSKEFIQHALQFKLEEVDGLTPSLD